MNPTLKKWVLKPLIIVCISLGVLLAIAFIIVSTQQERLVNLAVERLNDRFKGEVSIEESSISLFQHFPEVSVVLHNGQFFSDKTKRGRPTGQFEELYVGFSLRDILQQNYEVKKLFLAGGYFDITREEDGSVNLFEPNSTPLVAEAIEESDTASGFSMHLEKVELKAMRISFLDKASGRTYRTSIDKAESRFKMDSSILTLDMTSDMKVDITSANDSTFFRDKPIHLVITADYKLEEKLFEITSCNFKIHDAGFTVRGFVNSADTTDIKFRIEGDKQDFNLFRAFLPEHVKENLKQFQYDGKLNFDALIKGQVTADKLPLIEVLFGCEEAWFLNTSANKKVDQLGFRGFYTNGEDHSLKTSEIQMLNLSARPEKGIFKGHFVVRDFTNPKALVQINSELELKFLGDFLGIADLKQIGGKIKLEMYFKELNDIILPEESLNRLKEGIQSKLNVENLTFQIPGYPHAVRNMHIDAEMKDGRVTVDSASLKIGESDLAFSGSISDVREFLRRSNKSIKLALHANSKQMVLADLLSYDTALARKWNEEVQKFNISLAFETTVQQLLHPAPLPKGTFEIKNLRGSFKNYAHTFKDLGAQIIINDTLLRLRDFTGMIDSSDINFKGRVTNYQLWFDDIKKGKTQIAFDFKSTKFALRDVFGKEIRKQLPKGYRREELNNVWLRAKIDLKYDTIFRFAKAKVTNVSADLKKHKLKLHEISGGVKYGSKILSFDTLRGKIGNTDFDINLKYYFKGIDRNNNKVANSLTFKSTLFDADEMSQYDLAPSTVTYKKDSTGKRVAVKVDTSKQHRESFNIFMIPFSDFNAQIDIAKLKYNHLWLKEVNTKISMRQDQTISLDTLMMKVAGGTINMRGKFNGSDPDKIYFRSRIKLDQVDLEKMFVKLDHFGQDVSVNKNVKGRLTGEIKSYVQVHPNLVPILSNTKASMNLTIYNGTLVDFAPMQAMAGYFKDKNLRLIRFDTLANKLTFTNGVLEIPEMDINSSLGYIQLSGKQSLDLSMEYYARVPMKMVTKVGFSALFKGKPEEVDINQIDQIEYIDKDKKIAFMNLKVTGTADGNVDVALGKGPKKKKEI